MLSLSTFIHKNYVVLNQKTPISEANRAICDNQIGCLLVGDEAGNAVGIVTDRDFVCRGAVKSIGQEASIEQIMSHDLISADEGSSVSDVLQLMERNGIRRVPIIHRKSDGKASFSGIITLDDLIAANQVDPAQLSRIVRSQSQIRSEAHLFKSNLVKNEKSHDPSLALADSDSPPPWASFVSFSNRTQAAELVAKKLSHYRGKHPLILGIPRGSVPMAKMIADQVGGDLDVVLVHKIGAPDNPEYAIGSVSEFGTVYRSEAVEIYEIPEEYITEAAFNEVARLKQRRLSYSPVRPPINPKGRVVIIVDDGIATGSTMLAAIRAIRAQHPQKLVVAAPVASPRTLDLLEREVDELVILETPEEFYSISQFYDDFPQVNDEEVLQILTEAGEKGKHKETAPSRKKAA